MGQREQQRAEQTARGQRPRERAQPDRTRGSGVARAERAPDEHLGGDRDRVEHQRGEDEQEHRDLVRGERDLADPRDDRAGRRERGEQRGRAHEQLARDAHERPQQGTLREAARGLGSQQQPGERRAHAELRDDRPGGGAVEAQLEAVDEPHLEHDVGELCGDDDEQRRPEVADAAQVALTGERDQRRRRAAARPAPSCRR